MGGEGGQPPAELKSFVARVTKNGADHKLTMIVLNDGTPIKTVEVKVDDGQWMAATADPATTAKYGWKLYHYTWKNAPAGEHTLVSRVDRRQRHGAADRRGNRSRRRRSSRTTRSIPARS